MRSRKIRKIERMVADNIKKTPQRIRNEFRTLLQEFLFFRVKPIYKDEFDYIPKLLERSQSCPDLHTWKKFDSKLIIRKQARAMSECYKYPTLKRTQSETELEKIDKERTFKPSDAFMQQKDLILKVVDALSASVSASEGQPHDSGIDGFSDAEILATENYTEDESIKYNRRRAISDIRPPPYTSIDIEPTNVTWYGGHASSALKQLRKVRALSSPNVNKMERSSFFNKMKNKLISKEPCVKENLGTMLGFHRSSVISHNRRKLSTISIYNDPVLERTSIADVIRAITTLSVPQEEFSGVDERKEPPKSSPRQRRMSILPHVADNRRLSLSPERKNNFPPLRRFSLRPVEESTQFNSPSPSISDICQYPNIEGRRKFSVNPMNNNSFSGALSSSVKTQLKRKKRIDS